MTVSLSRWSRISSQSLIRELRVSLEGEGPQDSLPSSLAPHILRYAERLVAHHSFHHRFWLRNNGRFQAEQNAFNAVLKSTGRPLCESDGEPEANFYRNYMLRHRQEFQEYHRESWRRAFVLLGEEYRYYICSLVDLVKTSLSTVKVAPSPSDP